MCNSIAKQILLRSFDEIILYFFESRISYIHQRNLFKSDLVQSIVANWIFSIGHTPRFAASRRVVPSSDTARYNFSVGCRWRISIFAAQCDPPILPTTIKRLLSPNVYGYGAVISFPRTCSMPSRWTRPRLTLHPTLYTLCARPATFITTTSTRKNDLQLFMPAREINIYATHAEHANVTIKRI